MAWRCGPCSRTCDLARGVLDTTRLFYRPTALALHTLLDKHLSGWQQIDIWIVPLTPWCLLVLFRVVLWRKHGLIAGLLRGPEEAHAFRDGKRVTDAAKLSAHLGALRNAAPRRWPRGNAPILVTGTKGTVDLDLTGLPRGQRNRVRTLGSTLSQQRATKGFNREGFLANPTDARWEGCLIVQRTADAIAAAGVTSKVPHELAAPGRGEDWRHLLFPGA